MPRAIILGLSLLPSAPALFRTHAGPSISVGGRRGPASVLSRVPLLRGSLVTMQAQSLKKTGSKKPGYGVLIDASNVAMTAGNNCFFEAAGIVRCLEFFKERGIPATAVCSESVLKGPWRQGKKPNDVRLLHNLRDKKRYGLDITPRIEYDDAYFLTLAQAKGYVVVSNDKFRDWINATVPRAVPVAAGDVSRTRKERRAWVRRHVWTYAFLDGQFVPSPNFKPPTTKPKPPKPQTPRIKPPQNPAPAPAPSPTGRADGAVGVQRGDILSGEVVGYIKNKLGKKISAKVRLDGMREMDEPRRPETGEFQPGTVVAELPQEEVSLLEDYEAWWTGDPPLDKRVESGTHGDFQVLEVACGGRVTVSQKSYLQQYFNRLLQQWAGFEDHEYAYVRESVNPELNATEAMVEAARLSRECFELMFAGVL